MIAALVAAALVAHAAPDVALAPFAGGLERPVFVTPLPVRGGSGGEGAVVVVEQPGRLRVVSREGALRALPLLDVTDRVSTAGMEMGLLGVAFHPRYEKNGFVFVSYTKKRADGTLANVVSRFFVPLSSSPEELRADPASERVVLDIDDPASNHNGGMIAFGPDGFLYVGTGDGGGAGDRFKKSRDRQSLLAKMLRIDPSTTSDGPPYVVPSSNPFVGAPSTRGEIWAVGLRNPWRFSFDRTTGDLFVADVGQNAIEEIHVQAATSKGGEDYGWNIVEGDQCYSPPVLCEMRSLTMPVHTYGHDEGCSVTGGYVYRGRAIAGLTGVYVFADYCSGTIWGLVHDEKSGTRARVTLLASGRRISSFGEGEDGELFVVDHAGEVLRLVPAAAPAGAAGREPSPRDAR